jgi:protein O-mannosyl-transferase
MTAGKRKKLKQKNQTAHPWIFKPVWLLLVMLAIGLVTYAPELKGSFIFDDGFYVQNNPNLKDFATLTHWHQFRHSRPLYWFSFFLEKKLWGNNPAGYKVVNLSFHVLTAFILFFFLLHLLEMKGIYDRWFALAVSMLFLVSPLATEAVSYISGRNNGIGGFFFILGCFLYLKTLTSDVQRKKAALLTGSLATFVAAFLFKEVYIVFLLFYPLLYLWVRPLNRKGLFIGIGGIIALFMAVLVLSFTLKISPFTQIHSAIIKNSHHFNSQPLATNTYAIAYSLRLFAFPNALNIDHDLPVLNSLIAPRVLMAIASLLAIGFLLFFFRRKLPLSFPAYLGYLLLIAPTNSFVLRHGAWMIDPLSERNLYVCAMFFSIIAVEIITVLIRKPKTLHIVFSVLLLAFGTRTFTRNIDFSSDISLWQSSVNYSPKRARPYYNLAVALKDAGHIEEAIPVARKALFFSPQPQCYGLLSSLLVKNGQQKEAEVTLLEGLRTVEKNPALLLNQLGQLCYSQGRFGQAQKYLEQAVQQNPRLLQARLTLMLIQLDNGNLIAAQKNIRDTEWHIRREMKTFRAKQLVTDDTKAMLSFGKGLLSFQSGRDNAGVQFCRKAIELNGRFTEPMIKLGEYFYARKEYKESWSMFLKASRTPGFKRYAAAVAPYMRNLQKLLDNPDLDPGL